jgi:AAA family ATP:ADP antiporter
MKDRLFTLLGIEPGEESMVSMLLTQSVFLGIFFGTFDISAHSLFLSIFDEKMMARGYVVSGLAGIILTTIYTRLQTRLIFREFATINLIFVTLLTFVLWFLLLLAPSHWVVFMVFILLGPLNILAMLGFWGTTGRIFTLRQGKRLFNLVDAGLIIGIIISCYAIPMLLSLNFKSHNILLISAAALMAGSVIQMLIGKRFLKESVKSSSISESFSKKRSVFVQFRYDRYIRIMGIFIALSVMTAFFVQYSFMAVTREQYPAEVDMARFLGFFIGSMMIFTLLIKLLVFSYLIRNYGLKTCLVLSPVLVAAFTVVAVLIGMLMGYTPASSGFMLFFMLLALSRLFSRSLKYSI